MSVRPQIASLMYHEVTDDPTASGFQRPGAFAYKHPIATFATHLAQIAGAPSPPGSSWTSTSPGPAAGCC